MNIASNSVLNVAFVRPRKHRIYGQYPLAWYVRANVEGTIFEDENETNMRPIMCAFSRERDAQIGMAALLNAGMDSIEKLVENKPKLKEIMCSALQW